jgi:serine/threonine-protein kinase TTK/MPS1
VIGRATLDFKRADVQAVAGVHEQRIVHSDLKPANFLLVEGQLKLIDFGIAKAISGDTTSIARESQVQDLATRNCWETPQQQ